MIKIIFRLLQADFPSGDFDIDFATGKQKYPSNYKETIQLAKRKLKDAWQRTK